MNALHKAIARSIWRSGFIADKNKVRQQAKESMRRLIAIDISTELGIDTDEFLVACGLKWG